MAEQTAVEQVVMAFPWWQVAALLLSGLALLATVLWRMFVFYDGTQKDRLDAFDEKNTAAHAAITENVKANRDQIVALVPKLDNLGHDLAFFAGRQHERDKK